jgi:hypothetical protein
MAARWPCAQAIPRFPSAAIESVEDPDSPPLLNRISGRDLRV